MINLKEKDIKLNIKELKNIDIENTYFHFTHIENVEKIQEIGLIPQIGKNSNGVEETPKIFFSKGANGVLQLANVWIKWLIYKNEHKRYLEETNSPEEYAMAQKRFYDDCKSGKLYTGEALSRAEEEYFNFLSERCYMILDLEEGKDFDMEDIDEAKTYLLNKDVDVLKSVYGKFDTTNDRANKMELWNLHTSKGVKILPEKISVLKGTNKSNALALITEMREYVNDPTIDLTIIDGFLEKYNLKEKSTEISK